ncbi:hypothetical protein [Nocardia salmonicida]|uniref:hypothetical protein n=1 Tax=Nocardia salmonicida TaxID=53431 RepID=UPI0007A39AEB|nr:hypothetical protein [Nocardia salmonicida]
MGRESIDAQALIDAGLDTTDPQVWADQYRISDLLVCLGIWQRATTGADRSRSTEVLGSG